MLKKILCKIITFGRHWWTYASYPGDRMRYPKVWCIVCRHKPGDQWEKYQKYFLGKPKGSVTRVRQKENITQIMRRKKR